MTNQEWAEKNRAHGKVYQIHYKHIEPLLWLNWDDIILLSPSSIRPNDWPEPGGWFYGWARSRREYTTLYE